MNSFKIVLAAVSGVLAAGCAGSATHDVVSAYQASDSDLSCDQIKSEMMKAQIVIDGVNKDKEDWTAADVADGILWFPFNLIAKSANYSEALAAGSQRIARLTTLGKEKNCAAQFAGPLAESAAEKRKSPQEERELSAPEITLVHAGRTIDAFVSENDGIKSDVTIKFDGDGTMSGRTKSGYSDTGDWWVENDKLCRQWERWQNSVASCYTIMLAGNRTRWVEDDGSTHAVQRLRTIPNLMQPGASVKSK